LGLLQPQTHEHPQQPFATPLPSFLWVSPLPCSTDSLGSLSLCTRVWDLPPPVLMHGTLADWRLTAQSLKYTVRRKISDLREPVPLQILGIIMTVL
jgi:hypothetical protein